MSSQVGSSTSEPVVIAEGAVNLIAGQEPQLYAESVFQCMLMIPRYLKDHPEEGAHSTSSREAAHIGSHCYSELNGEQAVFAFLGYKDIQTLEGRLLTIVDAAFPDLAQRKAVKALVRNAIWFDWVPNLDADEPKRGKPDLER